MNRGHVARQKGGKPGGVGFDFSSPYVTFYAPQVYNLATPKYVNDNW